MKKTLTIFLILITFGITYAEPNISGPWVINPNVTKTWSVNVGKTTNNFFYKIYFGDEQNSNSVVVSNPFPKSGKLLFSHAYAKNGKYTIIVILSDRSGQKKYLKYNIVVASPKNYGEYDSK